MALYTQKPVKIFIRQKFPMTFFSRAFFTLIFTSSPYFSYRLLIHKCLVFISSSFITAKTAFHHRTFSFITAHFVHHFTLKQGLPSWRVHNCTCRTKSL